MAVSTLVGVFFANKIGLKARMNADLHMAEDLKNTGKGNLFVIFGEPDIDIIEIGEQIQVKVNGVDVFHPNTGEVRSDGADGIACWFIDTDYNEESFFVRHAYFLGANDPYKSLKTTLKAEINEEAWETLHSDTSRPFDKPKGGRIAVDQIFPDTVGALDLIEVKPHIAKLHWKGDLKSSSQMHRDFVKRTLDRTIKEEEMGDFVAEILMPVKTVKDFRNGKKRESEMKLYPSYLFVRARLFDDEGAQCGCGHGAGRGAATGSNWLPTLSAGPVRLLRLFLHLS